MGTATLRYNLRKQYTNSLILLQFPLTPLEYKPQESQPHYRTDYPFFNLLPPDGTFQTHSLFTSHFGLILKCKPSQKKKKDKESQQNK